MVTPPVAFTSGSPYVPTTVGSDFHVVPSSNKTSIRPLDSAFGVVLLAALPVTRYGTEVVEPTFARL